MPERDEGGAEGLEWLRQQWKAAEQERDENLDAFVQQRDRAEKAEKRLYALKDWLGSMPEVWWKERP